MKETEFSKKLTKLLRNRGVVVFNVHGHAMQASGWPDLQVYSRVWTGHLELKQGRGEVSPTQRAIIRQLKEVGTPAFVLRMGQHSMVVEDENGTELMDYWSWDWDVVQLLMDLKRL